MQMFCNQCEQTAKGEACTIGGVCGKSPEVAALQDLLVYELRGLGLVAGKAREKGIVNAETDHMAAKWLFTTLTNVNFDPADFVKFIHEAAKARDALAKQAGVTPESDPMKIQPGAALADLLEQAKNHPPVPQGEDKDIASARMILLYGLKGLAAYTDHAAILGQSDPAVYAFIHKAMGAGYDGVQRTLTDWVGLVMECGQVNLRAMELLDAGNTGTFGHPVPTEVPLGPKTGKAILVSGHDLADLHELLKQTEGKGINIYSHGEMLPTHAYPGLKKFKHFHGHFGSAWQNQQKEFPLFPGAILFTTNCIQRPLASYAANVFTTGLVGFPGLVHVDKTNFGPVIKKALELPGFSVDDEVNGSREKVLAGFGRNTVISAAGTVVDAVKSGAIKHFFLVGGCDGAKPGRNYYTEFVEKTPSNTIVLTLACGKFRFFDKKLGEIGGLPRLMDMGQCNDAYSAIQVAIALSKAFNCGVNDLPLSMILSWYEQKAVVILLTLLYLGIKDIRLGPTLPAFVSPNVLDFLVQNFAIKPITTPDEDLKAILG